MKWQNNKESLHQPNYINYKQIPHHHFSFNHISFMNKNPPGPHADKEGNARSRSISRNGAKVNLHQQENSIHPTKQDFIRDNNINT